MSEFSLIETYFSHLGQIHPAVKVGVGDDGAVLAAPSGDEVIVMDTMVANVHFDAAADPHGVGYKILAVNLSDLAAMGAEPVWATLALCIPEEDEAWVAGFAKGFGQLATRYGVQLIGGDTSRGPLCITVTAGGVVPPGQAVLRSGAKPGDALFVTGVIGEAGYGLGFRQQRWALSGQNLSRCVQRLDRPIPRVKEALAIRALIHSAIDISDGLLADLCHLTRASGVGVRLYAERIPLSGASGAIPDRDESLQYALSCGDDYELLFTAPPEREEQLRAALHPLHCEVTRIGEITREQKSIFINRDGSEAALRAVGYDHFGQ